MMTSNLGRGRTRGSRLLPTILVLCLGAVPVRSWSAASTNLAADRVTLPAGSVASFERRVVAGSDDAEESASGSLTTNSSDIELVLDKVLQSVGLRFASVNIPPGATITNAYLQFEADEKQSVAMALMIQGQAADNPPAFSAANRISTRARTLAGTGWAPAAWNVVGEAGANQRTPDLSGVIQDIVGRPGWASGNALVIVVTGTGHRTARAFEGKAAGAALLHVEFATGGPQAGHAAQATAAEGVAFETKLHRVSHGLSFGSLTVVMSLAGAEPASLEVMDVTGRRVASREVGSLGAGRHQVELREALPAGVYLVRLAQAGRRHVMKAVVTR